MADQILTRFTPELVTAIGGNVREISDHFLARELVSNEVHEQILESTATSADQARTLLEAIKDAVAIDQTIFKIVMEVLREVAFSADKEPPFMHEMERQYLLKSRSRKRRRIYSDPTMIDQELAARSKVSKPITDTKSGTVFIFSRVLIIEMFTKELISAMSTSIKTVCDQCLANGLISGETYRRLLEITSNIREDKAKILLQEVKETIIKDDRCFDLFLTTLNKNLPTPIGSKVVAEIIKESENYTLAPADSPCHRASDNSGDADAKHQLEEATTKLAEAYREKEGLEEELAAKVKEIEGLKEELFRVETRKKDNTERIKQLKEMIAEREHEISYLREKVNEKEKEVELRDMKMKRERELFQQESSQKDDLLSQKDKLLSQKDDFLSQKDDLLTKAKEVEAEMLECLTARNQNLKQDNMKLQKEKDGFMKTNIELEQKISDLLQKNGSLQSELDSLKSLKVDLKAYAQSLEQNVKKLQKEKDEFSKVEHEKSQHIRLLQSKLDELKYEHRNCIIRSHDNPCYCDRVGWEYCPNSHGRSWESCSIS